MPRTIQKKIDEVHDHPFVLEHHNSDLKEEMRAFIDPNKKLFVELGCGRGHYTLELARRHPEAQCIGIDLQGERLWYGANEAQEEGLENVRFFRFDLRLLEEVFPAGAIDDIWITFPDPLPKKRQIKKRLTNEHYLAVYKKLLKTGGSVHLKTDATPYYEYSKEVADEFGAKIQAKLDDVDKHLEEYPLLKVQTHFEKKWRKKGLKIHYLNLTF